MRSKAPAPSPHSVLKWLRTSWQSPFPMMKPPINRSYARLLTSNKHSNFEILCSRRMVKYNNMELWWQCGLQHYFKLPRLSSELLDERNDSNSPCGHISAHWTCTSCSQKVSSTFSFSASAQNSTMLEQQHIIESVRFLLLASVTSISLLVYFPETPLRGTGLVLELVPTDVALKSGRHISDSDDAAAKMRSDRWQLDFLQFHIHWQIKNCYWTRGVPTIWHTCWKSGWGLPIGKYKHIPSYPTGTEKLHRLWMNH